MVGQEIEPGPLLVESECSHPCSNPGHQCNAFVVIASIYRESTARVYQKPSSSGLYSTLQLSYLSKLDKHIFMETSFPGPLLFPSSLAPGEGKRGGPGNEVDLYGIKIAFFLLDGWPKRVVSFNLGAVLAILLTMYNSSGLDLFKAGLSLNWVEYHGTLQVLIPILIN